MTVVTRFITLNSETVKKEQIELEKKDRETLVEDMSEIDKFLGTWKFQSQSDTIEETLKAQGINILSFDSFETSSKYSNLLK